MAKAGNIVILMVLEDDVTDLDEDPAFQMKYEHFNFRRNVCAKLSTPCFAGSSGRRPFGMNGIVGRMNKKRARSTVVGRSVEFYPSAVQHNAR